MEFKVGVPAHRQQHDALETGAGARIKLVDGGRQHVGALRETDQHHLVALPLLAVVADDLLQIDSESLRHAFAPEVAQRIEADHRHAVFGQGAGHVLVQAGPATIAGNEYRQRVTAALRRHFHYRQPLQGIRRRSQRDPGLRADHPRGCHQPRCRIASNGALEFTGHCHLLHERASAVGRTPRRAGRVQPREIQFTGLQAVVLHAVTADHALVYMGRAESRGQQAGKDLGVGLRCQRIGQFGAFTATANQRQVIPRQMQERLYPTREILDIARPERAAAVAFALEHAAQVGHVHRCDQRTIGTQRFDRHAAVIGTGAVMEPDHHPLRGPGRHMHRHLIETSMADLLH